MAARTGKANSESQSEDDWSSPKFICERVCVSDKLARKCGAKAEDITPGNCVTVCGVSAVDACADACQRTVCVMPSHVPKWTDNCIKRCTAECLKTKQ